MEKHFIIQHFFAAVEFSKRANKVHAKFAHQQKNAAFAALRLFTGRKMENVVFAAAAVTIFPTQIWPFLCLCW